MGIAPGGMSYPLSEENRLALLAWIPEAKQTVRLGLQIIKKFQDEHQEMVESFATAPTLYMGLVGKHGAHEIYDGNLRFIDTDGTILEDQLSPKIIWM